MWSISTQKELTKKNLLVLRKNPFDDSYFLLTTLTDDHHADIQGVV